jgi:hypothetical protein
MNNARGDDGPDKSANTWRERLADDTLRETAQILRNEPFEWSAWMEFLKGT